VHRFAVRKAACDSAADAVGIALSESAAALSSASQIRAAQIRAARLWWFGVLALDILCSLPITHWGSRFQSVGRAP